MKPVYMISGGITKFAKAHPDKDFRMMVKEAYDYALRDVPRFSKDMIAGAVGSYFSDHFTRQRRPTSCRCPPSSGASPPSATPAPA